MKILNLYSCLGGNRYKWDEVANLEVVAVERDPELAKLYQERFPNDNVIVDDAHKYLLDHYKEFDFIWSSPPCPTHSRARFARRSTTKPVYPSMSLYEEIIFLKHNAVGKYCIENVIPYYDPLIEAQKRGRHLYWCNFNLPKTLSNRKSVEMEGKDTMNKWCDFHEYNFRQYKGEQPMEKIARNLVDYEAGKTILEVALGSYEEKTNQMSLF